MDKFRVKNKEIFLLLGHYEQTDRTPILDKSKNWTILNFIDGPSVVASPKPNSGEKYGTLCDYSIICKHNQVKYNIKHKKAFKK